MRPSDKDKKWGTIYLDASREATLDKLDAMQAATRQEQWNQRTQNDYLERVREKAVERAREILGQAYTERQSVLDEAAEEAQHIRAEAQAELDNARQTLAEAQALRHSAQQELDAAHAQQATAQEDGFNSGIEQAQSELVQFRSNMGASVASVLSVIHAQCQTIFDGWRSEMVELLKVCVEKGTGLALDERHQLILEHLIIEAVRQLDDRRSVTLRVHPNDENAVADMFLAAKERMPDIAQWTVIGDPSLEMGGCIAESPSGTVDSRLELHRELVENILQHLSLPSTNLDTLADQAVADAVRCEAAKIERLAPHAEIQEAALPPAEVEELALPPQDPIPQNEVFHNETLHDEMPHGASVPGAPFADGEVHPLNTESGETPQIFSPESASYAPDDETAFSFSAAPEMPLGAGTDDEEYLPAVEDGPPLPEPVETMAAPQARMVSQEPTREELEEELLPISEDLLTPQGYGSSVEEALARGGFLDEPLPDARSSPSGPGDTENSP